MSSFAVIKVHNKKEHFYICRYSDGYPKNVLNDLEKFIADYFDFYKLSNYVGFFKIQIEDFVTKFLVKYHNKGGYVIVSDVYGYENYLYEVEIIPNENRIWYSEVKNFNKIEVKQKGLTSNK